jgi:hypothetical protein
MRRVREVYWTGPMPSGGVERVSEQDSFLKRHGFLIAGVALPILVVVIFVLARTLPRLWVEDPRYDLVYGVRSSFGAHPRSIACDLAVDEGRLRVRWVKLKDPSYQDQPRAYRLHPATGVVEEIPLPEPDDVERLEGTLDLFVAGLEGFRLDRSPRSPDGYEFDESSGRGSGLLGELLVDRNRPRAVLRKGGRVIVLPATNDAGYGYWPVQFLGWLVPVEDGR